jgi:hypothetical protein
LKGATHSVINTDDESFIFAKIKWEDEQASIFSFCGTTTRKQAAILEIDCDTNVAVYVNAMLIKEISPIANVELGVNSLIPINLERGRNDILIMVISTKGPPRIRLSLVMDQSKDFITAWNQTSSFLNKKFFQVENDTPILKWDTLLNRMTVAVQICDILNEKIVIEKSALRTGNVIREFGFHLSTGIYRATYVSNSPSKETSSELFLVGSPRTIFTDIKASVNKIPWAANEIININAQVK